VAVPEPVTLAGVMTPQDRFAGTVSVNATTPPNPFRAVTVIVDVAEVPAWTAVGEVAAIVKSCTTKVTLVELVAEPLAAFTVTT